MWQGCIYPHRFERNVEIPGQDWAYSFMPEIRFTVTDTTSHYDVYITLRHTEAYAYRNLWLKIHTRRPGENKFRTEQLELILQDEEGRWLGKGMDDIYELRLPLFSSIRFTQKGEYVIKLEQVMRDNPLSGILNAGIRIEKAE